MKAMNQGDIFELDGEQCEFDSYGTVRGQTVVYFRDYADRFVWVFLHELTD